MMRGLALLPTLWLLLVLAHHGEGRLMPTNMFDLRDDGPSAVGVSTTKGGHGRHAAGPTPVPCTWVCNPENNYQCHCVPIAAPIAAQQDLLDVLQTEDATRTGSIASTSAAAARFGDVNKVVAIESIHAPVGAPHQRDGATAGVEARHRAAAPKPVPCTWVCGPESHIYECRCVPIPGVKGLGV